MTGQDGSNLIIHSHVPEKKLVRPGKSHSDSRSLPPKRVSSTAVVKSLDATQSSFMTLVLRRPLTQRNRSAVAPWNKVNSGDRAVPAT